MFLDLKGHMSSKSNIVRSARNVVEKIALRIMQGFLVCYSAVIAKHLSQRDAEFAKLRSEIIFVARDHHSRLLKLEQGAQVAEVS
jgi:hypothetical protein